MAIGVCATRALWLGRRHRHGEGIMTKDELDQFLERLYEPAHERRRREQEQQQQQQPEVQTRNLSDTEMAAWQAHFETRLTDAIAYEHELVLEAVGGVLGEMYKRLSEKIETTVNNQRVDRTAQAANLLRLDLDAFRHEIKRLCGMAEDRPIDKGDNVVMPDFLGKREREAPSQKASSSSGRVAL